MPALLRLVPGLCFVFLVACGGGGGSAGPVNPPPPPLINTVDAGASCADVALVLTISGQNFSNTATVSMTPSAGGTEVFADTVNFVSDMQITATFAAGMPVDTYDVALTQGSDSTSQLSAVQLTATPVISWVTPAVVYGGMDNNVTIQLEQPVPGTGVTLTDAGSAVTNLTGAYNVDGFVTVTVPAGTAGDYSVQVTSANGCPSQAKNLTLNDTLTVSISSVTPTVLAQGSAQKVVISSVSVPGPFESVPTIYLYSVAGGAVPLPGVTFISASQLEVMIDPGLYAAGVYDLILVNPSGSMGVASSALTISAAAAAVIDKTSRTLVAADTAQIVTFTGSGFEGSSTSSYECRLSGGGGTTSLSAMIQMLPGTTLVLSADFAAMAVGDLCRLKYTGSDGSVSYGDTLAVGSISNPVSGWATLPSLTSARRAAAAAAYRSSATEGYVYAIGGDNGTAAGAMSSIEVNAVDSWGNGTWRTLAAGLPAGRTHAGSVMAGDFVYLLGGHDGASATNTVWRAQVLQKDEVVKNVSYTLAPSGDPSGLSSGQWYYRITAAYDAGNLDNPNGESLPSELITVTIPPYSGKVHVTLDWSAGQVAGAAGYNIYRTQTPDADPSSVTQIAGLGAGTSYLDQGGIMPGGSTPPTPGDLGNWHAVGAVTLNTPREGLATVAVPNPKNANEVYVYAFGGRDDTGTQLDSYEYATITLAADGSQSLGTFTNGSKPLTTARADLQAWVVVPGASTQVSGNDVYIYLGGGESAGGLVGTVEYGFLDNTSTSADLLGTGGGGGGSLITTGRDTVAMSGYTGFFSRDALGGFDMLVVDGGATVSGVTSSGYTSSLDINPPAFPNNNNWNALGGASASVRRQFAAGATLGVFNFLIGGVFDNGSPSSDVEGSNL